MALKRVAHGLLEGLEPRLLLSGFGMRALPGPSDSIESLVRPLQLTALVAPSPVNTAVVPSSVDDSLRPVAVVETMPTEITLPPPTTVVDAAGEIFAVPKTPVEPPSAVTRPATSEAVSPASVSAEKRGAISLVALPPQSIKPEDLVFHEPNDLFAVRANALDHATGRQDTYEGLLDKSITSDTTSPPQGVMSTNWYNSADRVSSVELIATPQVPSLTKEGNYSGQVTGTITSTITSFALSQEALSQKPRSEHENSLLLADQLTVVTANTKKNASVQPDLLSLSDDRLAQEDKGLNTTYGDVKETTTAVGEVVVQTGKKIESVSLMQVKPTVTKGWLRSGISSQLISVIQKVTRDVQNLVPSKSPGNTSGTFGKQEKPTEVENELEKRGNSLSQDEPGGLVETRDLDDNQFLDGRAEQEIPEIEAGVGWVPVMAQMRTEGQTLQPTAANSDCFTINSSNSSLYYTANWQSSYLSDRFSYAFGQTSTHYAATPELLLDDLVIMPGMISATDLQQANYHGQANDASSLPPISRALMTVVAGGSLTRLVATTEGVPSDIPDGGFPAVRSSGNSARRRRRRNLKDQNDSRGTDDQESSETLRGKKSVKKPGVTPPPSSRFSGLQVVPSPCELVDLAILAFTEERQSVHEPNFSGQAKQTTTAGIIGNGENSRRPFELAAMASVGSAVAGTITAIAWEQWKRAQEPRWVRPGVPYYTGPTVDKNE